MENQAPDVLAYSIAGACKVIPAGRTKLYALIAEGRIEALRLDGRTVIPAASLRRFLAELPPAPIRARATPEANEKAAA